MIMKTPEQEDENPSFLVTALNEGRAKRCLK